MNRVCMCDYNKHTWWPWFYSLPRHSSITTFYLPKYALEQTDECVCVLCSLHNQACTPCLFIYLVIFSSSLFFSSTTFRRQCLRIMFRCYGQFFSLSFPFFFSFLMRWSLAETIWRLSMNHLVEHGDRVPFYWCIIQSHLLYSLYNPEPAKFKSFQRFLTCIR